MEDLIPTQCNVTNDKPIYIENQSYVPKISSLSSTLLNSVLNDCKCIHGKESLIQEVAVE